jgi:hypothetical protein
MRSAVAIALAGLLAQVPAGFVDAAEQLAPLLRGIERRLPGEVRVGPGALPPSPFSGTRATLFAFRVAKDRPILDEPVTKAIDQLLSWHAARDRQPATTDLAGAWVRHLMAQMAALDALAAEGTGRTPADCDLACVIVALRAPTELFGRTRQERLQTRDLVLLEALADAVAELAPPR